MISLVSRIVWQIVLSVVERFLILLIFQSSETLTFTNEFTNVQMSPGSTEDLLENNCSNGRSDNNLSLRSSRLSHVNDRETVNV